MAAADIVLRSPSSARPSDPSAGSNYRRYVRDFLISRGAAVRPGELAQLTADDLLAFSRQRGAAL